MPLDLTRIVETPHGTIGQYRLNHGATLYCMERMGTGDHPRIPAGLYEIRLDYYHHGDYPAYEIIVPGRVRILIHAANIASELLGCQAPGKALGFYSGKLAVMQSRMALRALMDSLNGVKQDYLTVHDPA